MVLWFPSIMELFLRATRFQTLATLLDAKSLFVTGNCAGMEGACTKRRDGVCFRCDERMSIVFLHATHWPGPKLKEQDML